MQHDIIQEARRQIGICNACRYCEGYCSVFPAMTRQTAFADGDITHLANLCHNCRGCYYACQYIEPHEFALNLPAILAEVRQDSWEHYSVPQAMARRFHEHGAAIALALVLGIAAMIMAIATLRPESGEGFYATLSHGAMVAIFAPAFLAPVLAMALGLRKYWRETTSQPVTFGAVLAALRAAATLRNLNGGQGQGCNFETGDRYSDRRRFFHQLTMYGFLLCFAATCAGTILHYGFGMHAPYPFLSLPKLLGVPGGIMLTIGPVGLAMLKRHADRALAAPRVWNGEMGFTLLLGFVGFSGLLLYAATGTAAVPTLLALHLGAVLAFFLLTPYSKMAHGFYRLAALVAEHTKRV